MSQKQVKPDEKKTAVRPKPTRQPTTAPPSSQIQLQRTLGNRALGQWIGDRSSVISKKLKVKSEKSGLNVPQSPISNLQSPLPIQAKLTVNAVGDKYEQEADAVAKVVVQKLNAPQPDAATNAPTAPPPHAQCQTEEEEPIAQRIQRQTTPEDEEMQLQRQELEEEEPQEMAMLQREAVPEEEELQLQRQEMPEEEELQLQRQGLEEDPEQLAMTQRQLQDFTHGGPVDSHIEAQINQSRGGGRPMDDSIRQPMEQAFGADFSDVRIHTDAQAHDLNQDIQARAFTTSSDIYFRGSEYAFNNNTGQELLAHELTHILQQNVGMQLHKATDLFQANPPYESTAKVEVQRSPGYPVVSTTNEIINKYFSESKTAFTIGDTKEFSEARTKLLQIKRKLTIKTSRNTNFDSQDLEDLAKIDYLINMLNTRISNRGNSKLSDADISLYFDGSTLIVEGSINHKFAAYSGVPKNGKFDLSRISQKKEDEGPIPEGIYWLDTSEIQNIWLGYLPGAINESWGTKRISIHPFDTTHTFGRGGFFIHGGSQPGSIGCIDLTDNMNTFAKIIREVKNKKIKLYVSYPKPAQLDQTNYDQEMMVQRQPQDFTRNSIVNNHIEAQVNQSRVGGQPLQDYIRYNPTSSMGQEFLTDELTHINQQNRGQTLQMQHIENPTSAYTYLAGVLKTIDSSGISIALYDVTETHHSPKSCPICNRYVNEKISQLANSGSFESGNTMSIDPDLITEQLYKEAEAWHLRKSHEDPERFALRDIRFFKTEAERFARDFQALALTSENNLAQGAMPIETIGEISTKILAVSSRVEELLQNAGHPQSKTYSKVKNIALFGHGGNRWMGLGGDLRPRDARQLVQNISENLTSDVSVLLYACSTARGIEDGKNSLSDIIHDELVNLGGHINSTVWGHTSSGGATSNPFWREFSGSETEGGGQSFFDRVFPLDFIENEIQDLKLTKKRQQNQLRNTLEQFYARELRGDNARNLPFQSQDELENIIDSIQLDWLRSKQREKL